MLRLVYGRAGAGKSAYIYEKIGERLKDGGKAILIVPEQQAVFAEKRAVDRLEGLNTFSLEILNFTRLANFVFRQKGGLAGQSIDRSGKMILMWRTLAALIPFMKEYANVSPSDIPLIELLLDACEELKSYRITPYMLSRAAEKTEGRLRNKLDDISLICAAYGQLLKQEYSDAGENADKLCDLLGRENLFRGYSVFVDSFSGFTRQEYEILRHIIAQADDVTLSLCIDLKDKSMLFDTTKETRSRLIKLLPGGKHEEVILEKNDAPKREELAFLEENFPAAYHSTTAFNGKPSALRVVCCENIYDECEFVSADIMKKIREGYRYRDIAVVCRDASRYDGLIDYTLGSLSIPFFLSKRTDITEKAVIKYILTAFDIRRYGWRHRDVIAHIKTGLTSLTPDECDEVGEYAEAWQIRGRGWTDEEGWTANPDGYQAFNEESYARLQRLNGLRERLVFPLEKMFESFTDESTVKDICCALFTFLSEAGIPEKLKNNAEWADRNGFAPSASEDRQLWRYLVESLDKLVLTAGDDKVDISQFASLLKMLLSQTDIGRLPSSNDAVMIGSARDLRLGDVKILYLLGANEGVFPADLKESGIFTDREKRAVEESGLEFLPEGTAMIADEIFSFYRTASYPSEGLIISYALVEGGKTLAISDILERILKLFPNLEPENYSDFLLLERAEGYKNSLQIALQHPDTPVGRALKDIYMTDGAAKAKLDMASVPLAQEAAFLSNTVSGAMYERKIALSQSRTDLYVKCPFSYFGRYILRLSGKGKNEFSYSEIGQFYHHVFERLLNTLTDGGKEFRIPDEDEKRQIIDSAVDEYMRAVCPPRPGKRLLSLFSRLKKIVYLLAGDLIEEFSQSEFLPVMFEQRIGDGEIEPFSVTLPDGKEICMYGIADRVDVYEKGNDVYLRVVDYKSNDKTFSLSDIALGLNMQTLIYLFSLWKNYRPEGKNILPAGAAYYSAKLSMITLKFPETDDRTISMARQKIKRSGYYLSDEDILRKMDKNLSGRYVKVKPDRSGELAQSASLGTLEDFGRLAGQVSATLERIGASLLSGDVSANPLKTDKHDGCEYCEYRPVCRRSDEMTDGKEDDGESEDE